MKTIVGILTLLLVFQIASGQVNINEHLNRLPSLSSCPCDRKAKEQFIKEINIFREKVQKDILALKEEAKRNSEVVNEAAAKNMMGNMGFSVSNADIQKMKNASKEQKKAMADEMMQQYMNMSVSEAKDVGKMSEQGKKAYAEAYITEKTAEVQANPKQNEAMQKHSMSMAEIAEKQNNLAHKIQAKEMSHEEKLAEYRKLKDQEYSAYEGCCVRVDKKFASMQSFYEGDEHLEEIAKEKTTCYLNYCSNLMMKYKMIMRERRQDIIETADDYILLDDLSNQLTSATTGSKKGTYKSGLSLLKAIDSYLAGVEALP